MVGLWVRPSTSVLLMELVVKTSGITKIWWSLCDNQILSYCNFLQQLKLHLCLLYGIEQILEDFSTTLSFCSFLLEVICTNPESQWSKFWAVKDKSILLNIHFRLVICKNQGPHYINIEVCHFTVWFFSVKSAYLLNRSFAFLVCELVDMSGKLSSLPVPCSSLALLDFCSMSQAYIYTSFMR